MEDSQPADSNAPPSAGKDVAERLRLAREERGLTQAGIATRTKMADPSGKGISRTAVIAYEQGSTSPGLRELKLLCDVLRVSPNWLVYGTEASAAVAVQSSMEVMSRAFGGDQLTVMLRTSLALMALKGHEREALQSLALSLAGRQLGDLRLSSLLLWAPMMRDGFVASLADALPAGFESMSAEDLAAHLASEGGRTNMGNRFRLDDEGEVLNPGAALYPDPEKKS
jgi:transcriptional regulator with XRE-family HTH domain